MNILHLAKFYPPVRGGIEQVTYDLVEGANALGMRADVLCFAAHRRTVKEKRSYEVIRAGMLARVFSAPVSYAYLAEWRQRRGKYDVIHLHVPNPLGELAVVSMPPLRGTLVVHWHSDVVRQRFLGRIISDLQKRALEQARIVVATSSRYAETSTFLTPIRHKVRIIPIGIDDSRLSVEQNAVAKVRERYGSRIVLCVGRLTYYKGFEYVIRAIPLLPDDAHLIIIGDGELRKQLSRLVHQLGLAKRVTMLHRVSEQELGGWFGAARAFVLPSVERSEAFGVVQLEAMAASLPVVSTSIHGSGVPWVNRDGHSGIVVPPRCPQALAEALTNILLDDTLHQRLALGARARFSENFRSRQMVDAFCSLYREFSQRGTRNGENAASLESGALEADK